MKTTYVYLIATALDDGLRGPVKVGVSDNPEARLTTLQTGSPHKLKIAHLFPLPTRGAALAIEKSLLAIKDKHRMVGEWLDLEPIIAASLIGLYIGTAIAAFGIEGDELDEFMREAQALPADGGEFKLNEGRL